MIKNIKNSIDKYLNHPLMDYAIYPICLVVTVITVPHIYQVFVLDNIEGQSIVTWVSYAFIALLWCAYGWSKKQKPLFFGNLYIAFLDLAVIVGILLHA